MIETSKMRRLAFAKYLYLLAVEQSKAPEPMAAASLLMLHDSVEFFLYIASEHLDVAATHLEFIKYWPAISAKLPDGVELTQKESMSRLNKARVALKHHGTLPSNLDLETHRATATAFFRDNTDTVFELNFDEISLIEFVRSDSAKASLNSVETYLQSDKLEEALGQIAIAFTEILQDYEDRKIMGYGRSPFFFGQDLTFQNSFSMGLGRLDESRELSKFVDRVQESIMAMQTTIKILALGIDYRRYSKFKMYIPLVHGRVGKHVLQQMKRSDAKQVTKEDVRFCFDFVVETAIHLSEFDYDVAATITNKINFI